MNHFYKEQQIREIMKKELEIPVCVTETIADTLHKTCTDYDASKCKESIVRFQKLAKRKRQIAAVLAICLLGTGMTVGAIELKKWNKYAAGDLYANAEAQDRMIKDGLATNPELSVTDHGVTVSVEQVVVDGYSEYVLFRIEAPEDVTIPANFDFGYSDVFGENSVLWIEEPSVDQCAGGALGEWDEKIEDTVKVNQEKNIGYYAYAIRSSEEGVLEGKELTFRLKDIVEYLPKAEEQTVLEGDWTITLPVEVQNNARKETRKCVLSIEGDKKMKAVEGLDELTMTPSQLVVDFTYLDLIPFPEYDDIDFQLSSVLPYVKQIKMKNGQTIEFDEEISDYVDLIADEETEKEAAQYRYGYEMMNCYRKCRQWSVKLCVVFRAAAMDVESGENAMMGIINPEEVEEISFEYAGEIYTYQLEDK